MSNSVENLAAGEVLEIIQRRWSPRAFSSRPVAAEELDTVLEAARWAASSRNEQPWHFLVGDRETDPAGYERIFSALAPANQRWAQAAPVLILVVARSFWAATGAPNATALYDTGMAAAHLVLQATELGLVTHQMGGFDGAKAIELLGIPAGHQPVAVIALGWPGDVDTLPPDLRERELAPRIRKPVSDFVFGGQWGQPARPA